MSQIPKESEALIDPRTGCMSRAWRQFFNGLSTSSQVVERITQIVEGQQPGSGALSDIAKLTTAGYLVNAGGTIVARSMQEGTGITITNPAATANATVFALALFDDTGAGDGLWKFTRDEFGRVEGTQEATAEDLAFNDALMALGVSDVQGALDLALSALPVFSATAPDIDVYRHWINTDDLTEFWRYDDGTSVQWVNVGGGNGADAFVPTYIAAGASWMVPEHKQALFHRTIDVDGSLVVDGALIEV
ncbi:hypothetical protein [Noviluteimonas gilva]|uniref:Uncharacterized protein n=1 Tax=Noviluteimonas gilva TaxID=2682097 RepID=A0A7C9HUE5_9GAMM|nr:hypothetical protein [Lysobacter gilvus]MUV13598.1 hypothetical protein [Lysobacter gilvus]